MDSQSKCCDIAQAGSTSATRGTGHWRAVRSAWARLAAAIAMASLSAVAGAHAIQKISILVSPEGSGPYEAFAVMQTYASKYHPWLRPIAVETPGFTYNVKYLAQNPSLWKDTIIGSGSTLEWAAKVGLKPYFPGPLKAARDFRILAVIGQTGVFFMTTHPEIKTFADLAGKRIATGLITQNEWGMYPRMILQGTGMLEKIHLSMLGTNPNVEALLDGRADVATIVMFSSEGFSHTIEPGPFKLLEASNRPYQYVDVPASVIEAYNKKTGANFRVRKYPPNTLPNQSQEANTYGDSLLLSAHKSFPEDLAYEFTKLLIKMGPVVAKFNVMGKNWDPHTICAAVRLSPNLVHPGALRACKEAGLAN